MFDKVLYTLMDDEMPVKLTEKYWWWNTLQMIKLA